MTGKPSIVQRASLGRQFSGDAHKPHRTLGLSPVSAEDQAIDGSTRLIKHSPHIGTLEYRLAGGRTVRVEEFYVSVSMLGFLAGRQEAIRSEVIKRLPEQVQAQFPGEHGVFIKPVPEGRLPAFTFMASLVCEQRVSDLNSDFSSLVVCWLVDEIETSLPELIRSEIYSIEWDQCAVDDYF